MNSNLPIVGFKKPALVLALATACSFGIFGCKDNNSQANNSSNFGKNPNASVPAPTPTPAPTPMATGDLIALTEPGQIVSVNRSAPETIVSTQNVSGLKDSDSLIGIDYRPADGKLYAVGALGNIYTIDPTTGIASFKIALQGGGFSNISGDPMLMSVDFNPAADRLRIVGNDGQNLRINVDTGATIIDGTINGGSSPLITSVAYSNSFATTGTTQLFDIDIQNDRLYLTNANAGTLQDFAPLGVDATGSSGFDIDGVNNMGYAALNVGGSLQLYALDLSKIGTSDSAATVIGKLPSSIKAIRGIALKPDMNAGTTVQGLSADNQLIQFNPLTPTITTSKSITGLVANESIVGIDYRLRTTTNLSGQLYGLSNLGNLYLIDTSSGAATGRLALKALSTDLTSPYTALVGSKFAVDFNPAADRLRVISDMGQNLRIDVDTGNTTTDGTISGVAGAVISGAAYTNSFQRPAAGTTTLYDIDQTSNQLLLQNPPNDGTISSVGALGVILGANGSMDIAGGSNGLVLASNGTALYRINLTSGAATTLADKIGGSSTPSLIDLAILLK
jgi:hypothetical protein